MVLYQFRLAIRLTTIMMMMMMIIVVMGMDLGRVGALRVHLRPVKVMTGSQLQLLFESHSNCHKLRLTAVVTGKGKGDLLTNLQTDEAGAKLF